MNQVKKDKLKQGGYLGGIGDMSYAYFKAQVGTAGSHPDLEKAFLTNNGCVLGTLQDRWKQYFTSQGIVGNNQSAERQWWLNKAP